MLPVVRGGELRGRILFAVGCGGRFTPENSGWPTRLILSLSTKQGIWRSWQLVTSVSSTARWETISREQYG